MPEQFEDDIKAVTGCIFTLAGVTGRYKHFSHLTPDSPATILDTSLFIIYGHDKKNLVKKPLSYL